MIQTGNVRFGAMAGGSGGCFRVRSFSATARSQYLRSGSARRSHLMRAGSPRSQGGHLIRRMFQVSSSSKLRMNFSESSCDVLRAVVEVEDL